ncbi:MAG: DnaB-like helicase N-terminal domain-containing protein [Xenococcaceae cyanobacterium]
MLTLTRPHSTISNNIPPQNIEAEEAILGGILLDPGAIAIVSNILPSEQAFYVHAHQIIYKACLTLHKKNQPTDLMAVTNYLQDKKKLDEAGGSFKLIQLLDCTVSTVNIDRHAQLVANKWLRRRCITLGHDTIDAGYDTFNDIAEVIEALHAEVSQYKSQTKKESCINEVITMRYQKIIEEFREIEMKCTDPGFRLFCIQELATKYRKSERQLESIFYKYLVDKEDEAVKYINKIREEIGDKVNAWYLHGFIPKGTVVLIHSLGGLGKSRLCYEFAYRLASGTSWGQFQVTAPRRKVLLVQTDELTTDTMRAIADRWTDSEIDCHIAHKSRWSVEHVARLKKEIQEHKFDVIVIDSMTSINKHNIFSENETEYARPILLLKEIAEELGCTFIIVHHSNSAGQSRGTKAIFNSVSLVLSLHLPSEGSSRETPNRFLCIEKSRFQRPMKYRLRYEIDEETHQWNWICDGEDVKEVDTDQPVKQRVLDDLASHRNTLWEAREIYERIGGTYDAVRRACYQLSNDGLVERRRSVKQGTPWGYFLAWEDDRVPDRQNNDQETIGNMIRNGNSDSISISGVPDHAIAKNASNNSQNILEKNNDRTIGNLPKLDTEQVSVPDHLPDRFPIVKKDNFTDNSQNADTEQVSVPDHLPDRQGQVPDHLPDRFPIAKKDNFTNNSQNADTEQVSVPDRQGQVPDRQGQVPDRTRYKYVGKDFRLEQMCLMQPYLQIAEVRGKMARVTAPNWKVINEIPLKDLKPKSDR